MKKNVFVLSLICFFGASLFKANAQVSVNHLSVSLRNCSQAAPNVIQFDIYVASDGALTSDLRANSFQFGINFNPKILSSNVTIRMSCLNASSDFVGLEGFHFPPSQYLDHIRIVQAPSKGINTGSRMINGTSYKVGTFILTSSERFVSGEIPDFEFQTATAPGKTICAALTWIGDSQRAVTAVIPGSGTKSAKRLNATRIDKLPVALSASIDCQMGRKMNPNHTEANNGLSLTVYPNPANGLLMVNFNNRGLSDYSITVMEASNREVIRKNGKSVEGINIVELDMHPLASGIYILKLSTKEGTLIKNFVKE